MKTVVKKRAQRPVDPKRAAKSRATLATGPIFGAAAVAQSFSIHGELDFFAVAEQLSDQCALAHGGDLRRAESMLTAQAHSLDAIFANLARRAARNVGEHLGAAETCLRLALKAQSQCRATLETLAAIKNPPVVFAKQFNVAGGHQQVNNGAVPRMESEIPQTELLEHDHGKRLDTGTASSSGRGNSSLEAVAIVNRPAHLTREGQRKS